MSKYSKSKETISTEFLLWDVPPTETSIEDVEIMNFHPINSLENSSTIDFDIPGFKNLMLSDVHLVVKFKVQTSTDTDLADNENVSTVNNFAHVLWQNVEIKLNGYNVEQSMSQSFHLRSFFDTCLNSDPERADYLELTEMFLMDSGSSKTQNESTIFYEADNQVVVNHAGAVRAKRISKSKTVTLITKLKSSIFLQDKSLPSDLPITITLTRNEDGVCLIHPENKTYKIDLQKVVLRCTFKKPVAHVLRFINQRLADDPALFYAPRGELSVHTIPQGVGHFVINNFYRSELPKLTLIVIQDRDALQNHAHKNIYSFKPAKSYNLTLNNDKYFSDDFETVSVSSAYPETALFLNQIYATCGYGSRGACLLNSKNFEGHFMMALTLTPDRVSHQHLHLQRHKDVKLEVNLGYTSPANHVLLAYSLYERFISIDHARTVRAI